LINELKFGSKLDEVYDALKPFTLEDYKYTNEHTGLLLHGPPGSGKTKIMEMIINISCLTSLVKPISSPEINRRLVGESENILRDIFNRAREFLYLLCVILVYEIETFAQDRNKDNQQAGKAENVNQLLSLMDFTGRVIIDLTSKVRNAQFELKNNRLHILDLKKYQYKNVNQLKPMLLKFTIEKN
jgi:SpoVK/Ycf46/Vps4 family AAA+-type ATPase